MVHHCQAYKCIHIIRESLEPLMARTTMAGLCVQPICSLCGIPLETGKIRAHS